MIVRAGSKFSGFEQLIPLQLPPVSLLKANGAGTWVGLLISVSESSHGRLLLGLIEAVGIVARHHANWRIKAMERHPAMDEERELAFTCPMALSRADAEEIRAKLVDMIDEVCRRAGPSPSEAVYFLNVDWLEL